MLEIFKNRSWQHEVISELTGNEGKLIVRLTNVPCLKDTNSGERKYAWPNFGHAFLFALHDALGSAETAYHQLSAGSSIFNSVRLPNDLAIDVEITGEPNGNFKTFESDLADAIISAFGSARLKP